MHASTHSITPINHKLLKTYSTVAYPTPEDFTCKCILQQHNRSPFDDTFCCLKCSKEIDLDFSHCFQALFCTLKLKLNSEQIKSELEQESYGIYIPEYGEPVYIFTGMMLEILESGIWCSALVLQVNSKGKLQISYNCYSDHYEIWIDSSSRRIRLPFHNPDSLVNKHVKEHETHNESYLEASPSLLKYHQEPIKNLDKKINRNQTFDFDQCASKDSFSTQSPKGFGFDNVDELNSNSINLGVRPKRSCNLKQNYKTPKQHSKKSKQSKKDVASDLHALNLLENPYISRSKVKSILNIQSSDAINSILIQENKTHGFIYQKLVEISDSIGQWWPAQMIQLDGGKILCRYDGWSSKYDEWIDSDSKRLRECKDANLETPEKSNILNGDIELLTSKSYRKSIISEPRVSKKIIKKDSFNEKTHNIKQKKILRNLKDKCEIGAHVQVNGPDGWKAATIVSVTPFRNFEEWVPMKVEYVRFVRNGSDSDDSQHTDSAPLKKYNFLEETPAKIKQIEQEGDSQTWIIYCNQCQSKIEHQRYYCTYCESPSDDYEYESYDLCIYCFQIGFRYHQHPRSSFAAELLLDTIDFNEMVEDFFDESYIDSKCESSEYPQNSTIEVITNAGSSNYINTLIPLPTKKICIFCNDDDIRHSGPFIGPYPFILPLTEAEKRKKKTKVYWCHEGCAKYSPEVIFSNEKWYNVGVAVRRGRNFKCAKCKERGATIGCFEPKCPKSYHLACTLKSIETFQEGYVFWCPNHESKYNRVDDYEDAYHCDCCEVSLGLESDLLRSENSNDQMWFTCTSCSSHFSTYDLCPNCFTDKFPISHSHGKENFKETNINERKQSKLDDGQHMLEFMRQRKAIAAKMASSRNKQIAKGKQRCSYCWADSKESNWNKGRNGITMCDECYSLAPKSISLKLGADHLSMDSFSTSHYHTRQSLKNDSHPIQNQVYLDNYGPNDDHLFSLFFDSSYYDVIGRPRWANHSGLDYHGTWLPQIVRRSLLKFTSESEHVLSNFVGRGTDAIECLLLKRHCYGIDINPHALQLAHKNVSFPIPADLQISATSLPTLVLGDSRKLAFPDNSYDHILSHPPYKDCVLYSDNIDGDISRISDCNDFQIEMEKIAKETWRVLKPNKRVTFAIGDNRRDKYYQPVSFQTFETYIKNGFEIEELILKRQRNCQTAPLGTYLCTTHDFLMFTHEFVVIFRKVDKSEHTIFSLKKQNSKIDAARVFRKIPFCPIQRNSIVMGTIWTFSITNGHTLSHLAVSKVVERFGKDDTCWEFIDISKFQETIFHYIFYTEKCKERDDMVKNAKKEQEKNDLKSGSYEQMRLNRILENKKQLLSLGLISDLKESGQDDSKYAESLFGMPKLNNIFEILMSMIIIPHLDVPNTAIFSNGEWIQSYRHFLIEEAESASTKLMLKGIFAVGVKDVWILDHSIMNEARYIPLCVLVTQDLSKIPTLRLKEFVGVVEKGYVRENKTTDHAEMKNRLNDDIIEWNAELIDESNGIFRKRRQMPIVNASYLLFEKFYS